MNAKRMPKLPCPFCGSIQVVVEGHFYNHDRHDLNAVTCLSCDVIGPMTKTIIGAVRKWNERKAT